MADEDKGFDSFDPKQTTRDEYVAGAIGSGAQAAGSLVTGIAELSQNRRAREEGRSNAMRNRKDILRHEGTMNQLGDQAFGAGDDARKIRNKAQDLNMRHRKFLDKIKRKQMKREDVTGSLQEMNDSMANNEDYKTFLLDLSSGKGRRDANAQQGGR